MLRHHFIAPLFVLLMALPFMVDYFKELPWIYYLIVILIFLSIEVYGAYSIRSNFHLKTICSISTNKKLVSLSFDDGPCEESLKILDVLKEHSVKATFFCIGNKIEGNEAILKRMDVEGHLIGNHSFSHTILFDLKGTHGFVKELSVTSEIIKNVIHKSPLFFRPPYGVTTPALSRAVKKLAYSTIGWNIRSLDTTIKDKAHVLQRIQKRLKPGSIILLHDTISNNAELVNELVKYLKSENYSIVSLDTLIQQKAYA